MSRSAWLAGALILAVSCGCRPVGPAPEVVVYTSVDEPYARPVLAAFARESRVRVRSVFDTEASKSRGLALRLQEERQRPVADAFWSGEVMQTLALRAAGVLAPYRSPSAAAIPARYRDPEGYWTGFAARLRVLVYDRDRVRRPPRSLLELSEPRWRGAVAMANPLFGTTMTEAAALFQLLGAERARAYYRARRANDTRIVEGNSVAADQTARGEVRVGQTDTDDALVRIDRGLPLGMVFPDQEGMGALLIPSTVALVRGAPHPEAGRRLIDFLLRPETELLLAGLPSRQLPLHPEARRRLPAAVRPLASVRTMAVDYPRLREQYAAVDAFLRETFLR